MDSSTKSSNDISRIHHLEYHTDPQGQVTVTVIWNKLGNNWGNKWESSYTDTSHRRWLRRQIKRIVDNIENDVEIKRYDLFMDSTVIVFYRPEHAAQFILENN